MMGNNEGSVENTLRQRGSVYGSYKVVCNTRTDIMTLIKEHYEIVNKEPMGSVLETKFGDIVLKLVRAAGAPKHTDSWHDLAGYATLIEKDFIYEKDSTSTKE